ncbi:carbon-nitrogen hydrolase [Podospora aff. communis PSN243]|uniref:Carbon-nitrogen hydrolase n=1 Tax=Podospora aff. communis PSN243 TaxID=3040156 RepID=A0AAV9H7N2_9PEZI|nr:carbon-nitrogen hydrolase [Podospora aff. communis PSN243]
MRIGCLQFAPQVGDVSNNLNRADACLARADPMELENLDLLVLPEMAFSGYNFKSLEHIMPFLEPSGSGISALWARTSALKYDCIVAVGYPEKVDSSRQRRFSAPRYYNSLIMVNGDGETLANYRKSFLYYTDATWASEGDGFFGGEIDGLGQVAMGICMDIKYGSIPSPYRFEMPWNTYEFGFHILEVKANLVILSMAWLTQEDPSTFTPFTQEPDMETISYWVQRLEPVIRKEQKDEIIVVFCNRCGIEDDVVYAGTSAVVGIKNGEVSVYGLLGRGVKELLIVNTDLPPFAKLVSREKVTEPAPEPLPHPTAVPVPPSMVSPAKASPTKDRLSRLPEADEPVEDPPATAIKVIRRNDSNDSSWTSPAYHRSAQSVTPFRWRA